MNAAAGQADRCNCSLPIRSPPSPTRLHFVEQVAPAPLDVGVRAVVDHQLQVGERPASTKANKIREDAWVEQGRSVKATHWELIPAWMAGVVAASRTNPIQAHSG